MVHSKRELLLILLPRLRFDRGFLPLGRCSINFFSSLWHFLLHKGISLSSLTDLIDGALNHFCIVIEVAFAFEVDHLSKEGVFSKFGRLRDVGTLPEAAEGGLGRPWNRRLLLLCGHNK